MSCLSDVVQAQLPTDPIAFLVHDNFQQPSADRFRCLLAWVFPDCLRTSGVPMQNMVSHALWDSDSAGYSPAD